MTKYRLEINKTDYDYTTIEADSHEEAHEKAQKWLEAYNDNMVAEDDYSTWEMTSLDVAEGEDDDDNSQ